MAFAFQIQSGTRDVLIQLCEKYNPGRTVTRKECTHLPNGGVVYTIDVFEPTSYGIKLLEWLRRGEAYEREGLTNPGPIWCLDHPNRDQRVWKLTMATPLPRHS